MLANLMKSTILSITHLTLLFLLHSCSSNIHRPPSHHHHLHCPIPFNCLSSSILLILALFLVRISTQLVVLLDLISALIAPSKRGEGFDRDGARTWSQGGDFAAVLWLCCCLAVECVCVCIFVFVFLSFKCKISLLCLIFLLCYW